VSQPHLRAIKILAIVITSIVVLLAVPVRHGASSQQTLTKAQLDFFESRIRPIFVNRCYTCHSPSNGTPKSSLELDWKGGWEKGGSVWASDYPGRSGEKPAHRCGPVHGHEPPNAARWSTLDGSG
jgi:hypothetical protein